MLGSGARRPDRGFSLVELMITITVMAILMAAVSPAIGNWMVSSRQRGAAEAVLSGLQKARLEAIRRNQPVSFWLVASSDPTQFNATCALSSSSASWVISRNDPTGKCSDDPNVKVDDFIAFSSAGKSGKDIIVAAVDRSSAAANNVRFDALGLVVNGANSISTIDFTTSSSETRRLRIAISAVGSVRLCDRDVAAPDPRAC